MDNSKFLDAAHARKTASVLSQKLARRDRDNGNVFERVKCNNITIGWVNNTKIQMGQTQIKETQTDRLRSDL